MIEILLYKIEIKEWNEEGKGFIIEIFICLILIIKCKLDKIYIGRCWILSIIVNVC